MPDKDTAMTEDLFEQLSVAIDAIPESKERLFLAKLAFLACREVADRERVTALIERATRDLERED